MLMHSEMQAQIKAKTYIDTQGKNKAQIRALLFDKAPTEVLTKYSDYSNIFSVENVAKLPENTGINEHAIKPKEDKQLPFGFIYSLGRIKLEMLKITLKSTCLMASSGFLNSLPMPLFCLIKNRMGVSIFA